MLRRMELDLIAGLDLSGEVLDFGGGEAANYRRHMPDGLSLRSVNISDEFRPTDLVAVGDPIPFADDRFDAVVTFNTLEHIHDDVGSLAEVTRVLKPGGVLHVIVPWMYPVHGHPDDFHRHAPSWWATTLAELGYAETALTPLVFGRRTSALMIKGRGDRAVRGLVESIAAALDIAEARLRFPGAMRYSGRRGETVWSSAPGWYIRAQKAQAAA
jgi:SAM-dependent methyltransferase